MSDLDVLVADGNSPLARRARVKLQPRDKKGRWVPTGAGLIAAIANIGKIRGKAIGGTSEQKGVKNKIRMLVGKGYEDFGIKPNTVLEVDPKNGELDTGIRLNKEFLKKKGINPDLQHSLPKSLAEQPERLADMNPQPADDLDIELAEGGLSDAEDKDFRRERDAEPLAKLPPALAEEVVEGEDVRDIVEGKPPTLPKAEKPEAGRPPRFPGDKDAPEPTDVSDEPKPPSITPEKKPLGKPPRFPGDKGVPEPTDVSDKPKPPTLTSDEYDSTIKEAWDSIYGGNNDVTIDEVVAEASGPEEVSISDLKPGDIVSLGKQGNKRVAEVKPVGSEGDVELYVDDYGRKALVGRVPGSAGIKRLRKAEDAPKKPTPEAPEAPRKPEKPEAPRKPKPKPAGKAKGATARKPKKAEKAEKVNLPNRKDDGKDIAPSKKSNDELREKKIDNLVDEEGRLLKVLNDKGNSVVIEDPNAIVNGLLEENPNAKIKEDGTVVVERGNFTDTDGKKYNYEIGVQRTVGNQFMERYTIKDADTGNVAYDFYNADYKDSFGGLYGKTSGLRVTRDYLLGNAVPGKKGTNEDGVPLDKELSNYFGPGKNIDQRLKYLRKTKDVNNWRLVTPEENIQKYLTGRARELNKSDKENGNYKSQFGNVRRSFVASTWEGIDLRDNELVKERLVQLLGRLPNTPESVDKLIETFKQGINDRYKGTDREKELQTLPVNMKKFLEDASFDLRVRDEVPFVSEDGVSTVKVGDRVRFINNEGDMVVGEVVKLNAGSGKNGGFKDTARVRFGNETVDNLQTRNMLHSDEEVTDYAPWVRNDEKLRRRAEELGIDFEEYKRRKEDNPEFDPGDKEHAPSDAGDPYLGEQGEAAAPTAGGVAEDLRPGDALYSADGEYIGTIIGIQEVPAADGGEPGVAVRYLDVDGAEKVEVLDRGEFRGPK